MKIHPKIRRLLCINFNYTHTLEDMFDIDKTNVLYIHNRLPDKRNPNYKGIDFERDILALAKKQFQFGSVNNYLDEWIILNAADGTPRLINKYCNASMLIGNTNKVNLITTDIVMQALNDCELG